MTRGRDDDPPVVRRINRNSRLREAQAEYTAVEARAANKLTQVLLEQYPPGTPVSWVEGARIRHGLAVERESIRYRPYLCVRENTTKDERLIQIEDILKAGDDDPWD